MTAVYTYEYDTTYHPSIPMIDLAIGIPLSDPDFELTAIVDSGADATMIPQHYLQQLGARRSRKAIMRGVTGEQNLVDLYVISVRLGPYRQGFLEVVGMMDNDDSIVGRDVLNHLAIVLNGPASVVEIREIF